MGAHRRRASLRPQPPTLAQRLLVIGFVFFIIGSFLCLHGLTTYDWSILHPTSINSHLRSMATTPVLDHVIAKQQDDVLIHPTLREVFKQRASVLNDDQCKVVEMTKYAWNAYRAHGNWSDLLNTLNRTGATLYDHDMAFTAVDSLDTLLLMGLHDEFDEASQWIKNNLRDRLFVPGNVSFAETSTRLLGGLLAAYHISGDVHLLQVASELGEALEAGLKCGIFVPCKSIDLEWGITAAKPQNPTLAEAASFLLEFQFVNHLIKKRGFSEYLDNFKALSVELTHDIFKNGLVPVAINWETMSAYPSNISFGAQGDVFYEYQLKQWLQTGKRDEALKENYLRSIKGLQDKMIGHTSPSNLTFVGLLSTNGTLLRQMDHQSCFLPGLLALGYHHGLPVEHLKLATELMDTCIQMYLRASTTLAAQVTHFHDPSLSSNVANELTVAGVNDYNLLGPETIESLMVLHRVTKNDTYRRIGRRILDAFEASAKVPMGGYQSLHHVFTGDKVPFGSTMPMSFLSETLKYFYLLFSDDNLLSLDEVVFNTHGHPFPLMVL